MRLIRDLFITVTLVGTSLASSPERTVAPYHNQTVYTGATGNPHPAQASGTLPLPYPSPTKAGNTTFDGLTQNPPSATDPATCCYILNDFVGVNTWYAAPVSVTVATVLTYWLQYDDVVVPANSTIIRAVNATAGFGKYGIGNAAAYGQFFTDLPVSTTHWTTTRSGYTAVKSSLVHPVSYSQPWMSAIPHTLLGANGWYQLQVIDAKTAVTFEEQSLTIHSPTPYFAYSAISVLTSAACYPTVTNKYGAPSVVPNGTIKQFPAVTDIPGLGCTGNGQYTYIKPRTPVAQMFTEADYSNYSFYKAFLKEHGIGGNPCGADFEPMFRPPANLASFLAGIPAVSSAYPNIGSCTVGAGTGEPTAHIPVHTLTAESHSTITMSGPMQTGAGTTQSKTASSEGRSAQGGSGAESGTPSAAHGSQSYSAQPSTTGAEAGATQESAPLGVEGSGSDLAEGSTPASAAGGPESQTTVGATEQTHNDPQASTSTGFEQQSDQTGGPPAQITGGQSPAIAASEQHSGSANAGANGASSTSTGVGNYVASVLQLGTSMSSAAQAADGSSAAQSSGAEVAVDTFSVGSQQYTVGEIGSASAPSPSNAYQVLSEAIAATSSAFGVPDPVTMTDATGSTHTVSPGAESGIVIDGSISLSVGQATSLAGLGSVSANSQGMVMPGTAGNPSTVTLQQGPSTPNSKPAPSGAIVSIGSAFYTIYQPSTGATAQVYGSSVSLTVSPGAVGILEGQTVSFDLSAQPVVSGSTVRFSALQSAATPSSSAAVLLTIGSQTLTAVPVPASNGDTASAVLIAGQTLIPGAEPLVSAGHTFSAASNGVVEDGTLVPFTTVSPVRTSRSEIVLPADGQLVTAVQRSDGAVQLGSQTLVVGGSAVESGGHTFSAVSGAIVEDGSTISFASARSSEHLTEAILTFPSTTMTAISASGTDAWYIGSRTLQVGGSALVSEGHTLSAASNGLLEDGTPLTLTTATARSGLAEGPSRNSGFLPAIATAPPMSSPPNAPSPSSVATTSATSASAERRTIHTLCLAIVLSFMGYAALW